MRALKSGLFIVASIAALLGGATAAAADPALGGDARAFGASVTLADQALLPPTALPPTPEVSVSAPAFPADATQTTLPVPAEPLAVNGTLIASGSVHQAGDLSSALEVEDQSLAGPYNAQAVGQAEDVEVLIDAIATDVPVVEADAVRGEVVAVCSGDTVEYSASSEAVNLVVVAGDDALGDVLNDIIDQLFPALDPLDPVVNIEENVVTSIPGGGLAVDALVVTVLEAVDANQGLVQARIGHAELTGVTCGGGAAVPQCSDTADNDGDGVIDAADPGCHTDGDPDNPDSFDPNDDDETDVVEESDAGPECADGLDNDGDAMSDIADPDCHVDGDATNPDSFDPTDDSEAGVGLPREDTTSLPLTGASVPTTTAAALGVAALALHALRRRTAV